MAPKVNPEHREERRIPMSEKFLNGAEGKSGSPGGEENTYV